MQPETPTSKPRRGRHFGRWILAVILATFGWYGWKAYDFHFAKQEAKALGWKVGSSQAFAKIRRDWRDAFRIQTWSDTSRTLLIPEASQFGSHSSLLKRLNPDHVICWDEYLLKDLSAFQGLSRLSRLELYGGRELTNLNALMGMKGLKWLFIGNAPSLKNIDGIKDLQHLSSLHLRDCPLLSNVDALRDLKLLEDLDLGDGTNLQNIDGLHGLTQLKILDLSGCTALPKEAVDALKSALPKTVIFTPDGEIIARRRK